MITFADIIGLTWIIFFAYWILNWKNAKPTREKRQGLGPLRLYGFLLIVIVIVIAKRLHLGAVVYILNPTPIFGIIGVLFSIVGLTIAIAARRTLGGNWSSNVELKEGHTLTTCGIYGIVRHPIYLGMFLMAMGAAMVFQSLTVLVIIFIAFAVFMTRIKREERLMMKTLPKEYPKYKKRVKALIPFVW